MSFQGKGSLSVHELVLLLRGLAERLEQESLLVVDDLPVPVVEPVQAGVELELPAGDVQLTLTFRWPQHAELHAAPPDDDESVEWPPASPLPVAQPGLALDEPLTLNGWKVQLAGPGFEQPPAGAAPVGSGPPPESPTSCTVQPPPEPLRPAQVEPPSVPAGSLPATSSSGLPDQPTRPASQSVALPEQRSQVAPPSAAAAAPAAPTPDAVQPVPPVSAPAESPDRGEVPDNRAEQSDLSPVEDMDPGDPEPPVEPAAGLLSWGRTAAQRLNLAAELELEPEELLHLLQREDLMRIEGVGAADAELLLQAGVGAVQELAAREPQGLASQLGREPAEIQRWALSAAALQPLLLD